MDAIRPAPWAPPPDGFHYEAVPARPWRMIPDGVTKACRAGAAPGHRACGAPAVAELNRSYNDADRPRWWAYCAEHLFGRWVEDGQVMGWRLIRDEGS